MTLDPDVRIETPEARRAFVRTHTTPTSAPLVPELVLHTATEVTALWEVTAAWLGARGMEVPFWSVPWAGGQGLARFLLDRPETVRGKRVLDFGTGGGIVAMAAARAGAEHVLAVDVDPFAVDACLLNVEVNGLGDGGIDARVLDVVGQTNLDVDLLVAGDVWYDRALATVLSPWLSELASGGVRVLTGDPGRSHVPPDVRELARYVVSTTLELESTAQRLTRVLEIPGRAEAT